MPNMCETRLMIVGERVRLNAFLAEIGIDFEARAAAEARMGRLVESEERGRLVLHVRDSFEARTAYCGAVVDAPERRWASPGWDTRDLEPEGRSCRTCAGAAGESDLWRADDDRRGMLSFNDILPAPEGLSGDALRKWRIEHWGTKWDLGFTGSHVEEEQPGAITIKVENPWGPPLPVIDEMARRAPDLRIKVTWEAEPMGGASDEAGRAEWLQGIRVFDEERPESQDWYGEVPSHMVVEPDGSSVVIHCAGSEVRVVSMEAWRANQAAAESLASLNAAQALALSRFLRYWLNDDGEDPVCPRPGIVFDT